MTIIYLHGLDSGPNAQKAQITTAYAAKWGVQVLRPNLNCAPDMVLDKVLGLIEAYPDAVLIGSSLGGYFANLIADMTGVPAVLLNPSIRPDVSLRRFLSEYFANQTIAETTTIYETTGGWQVKYGDLAWFEMHRLQVAYPERLRVLLKLGDELLDGVATKNFYQAKGVAVLAQVGGDHQISDYDTQVALVFDWVRCLSG